MQVSRPESTFYASTTHGSLTSTKTCVTEARRNPPGNVGLIGMMDAMVLAYTASLEAEDGLTARGGETEAEGLPMEIVRPEESSG